MKLYPEYLEMVKYVKKNRHISSEKIKTFELTTGDDINHQCPLCDMIVYKESLEGNEHSEQLTPCEHLLFIATDSGWEFRSDYFIKNFESTIVEKNVNFDKLTSNVILRGSVKFAVYKPAPSFFGVYYGYFSKL